MGSPEAAVLARIEQAFSGVSREGGISLHEATAMDDYASPEQRAAARELDREPCWQSVPDDAISRNSSVFSYLDVIGTVYYAPASMAWLVRTGYSTDSNSMDAVFAAFNPWGKWEHGRRLTPDQIFSREQCQAIAAFFVYVHEVLDEGATCSRAKDYLDRYWSAYRDDGM